MLLYKASHAVSKMGLFSLADRKIEMTRYWTLHVGIEITLLLYSVSLNNEKK
ncbi:hypothetical protein ACJX0J_017812, partial [Zea mays]